MPHECDPGGVPMSATLPATQFEALRDHLLAHSVKRGDFVLKSGSARGRFPGIPPPVMWATA